MDDKLLLKTSFLMAVLGLSVLIILGNIISLEESNIGSLDNNHLEKNVKIKGLVNRVQLLGSIKIVEIQDNTGKINAVIFSKEVYIEKGSIAEIEGKLSIREGELQINAETIKVFS